jgi:hypothetical protein
MQPTSDSILAAALQLPEAERLTVVSRLLETMSDAEFATSLDDPNLPDDLDRRFADREGSVPWSELRAEE